MVNFVKYLTFFLFFALPMYTAAQAVTPAMMEQFKQLPKAQQEQLAKQYGIDLSELGLEGTTQSDTDTTDSEQTSRAQRRKQQQDKKKPKTTVSQNALA